MRPPARTSRQETVHRCDCGRKCLVERKTRYEFDWRCECGAAGRLAWAHAKLPPLFEDQPVQAELFDKPGG